MDIVAESLSAKILKSKEVLVNGKDIMDYIRSKLSTAVQFSGVYNSLEEANAAGANFNGSIVIIGSIEYIWYDKDNKWHQIGDETAVGQIAEAVQLLSNDVKILSGNMQFIASISTDLSCEYKLSAEAGSMAYENADNYALTSHNHDGTYLKEVPSSYKTYQATLSSLSSDGYATSQDVDYAIGVANSAKGAAQDALADALAATYAAKAASDKAQEANNKADHANEYAQQAHVIAQVANEYAQDARNIAQDANIAAQVAEAKASEAILSAQDAQVYAQNAEVYAKAANDKADYANMRTDQISAAIPLSVSQLENDNGYISAVPNTYKTYDATVSSLSASGYVLSNQLSTKNKTEIAQSFEGQFIQTDLSIIKVGDDDLQEYAKALHDNTLNPNALYVLQLSAPNAFGQPIHNIASGILDSDAATYGQLVSANNAVSSVLSSLSTYAEVKQQLSNDGYAMQTNIPSYNDISTNIHLSDYTLTSTTSQVANELSNAISSKVYVGNLQTGEHTDLSVLKVTSDEYEQLVADANSSSVDLSNNVIYIVSSDNMNMYGEKILNLTMEEDDEPSEATNKHYVDSHLSGLSSKIDVLSTYEQTKSQLMTDGFAQTSSIPSYNDISVNIHLSNYALVNNVSSTTELNAKFNTLSTYSQTKQQLSSDGYATLSNIPSYSDISTNIHLSDYALSNDVSSKTELEAAFNQKLDATAAGKAFSPLSTYSLYEHVSYNGQLYECSAVVSATGDFQLSNWQLVDMTSPDATLDITNQGQLRLVAADGTTLWHQGYNLAVSSSTILSIDAVNRYDFAWNATSAVALTIPTPPNGKVGDFILDVTLTALAPFLSTVSYNAGKHVIQNGICWTSTISAEAGSWDVVSGNWTSEYVAWDQTSSYTSADNPVVKDGMLWKCVAAESTTVGDWTQSDWTTASFGLPQLEAESIKVVVPENNNLADMLTFAPGQIAELYFTQTSFTASGQPTWKVVRQNVEEAGV